MSYAAQAHRGRGRWARGKLLPLNATLRPEAIQQQEIVVEAKAKTNTEACSSPPASKARGGRATR